jgi:L-ascorbate metabolism protein UlaG (beta-lactamase superfamily)
MQVIKWGHACVRVEHDGAVIVLDPGMFTDPAVLQGADAVLVTHEHPDHLDPARLRAAAAANPELAVWTHPDVAAQLEDLGQRVHPVRAGDRVSVAGLDVEVHGEWHELIHPDIPRVHNVGFLLGGVLFHPGDAFTLPGRPVEVLLVPVHAPWSKTREVLDYIREVSPARALTAHDGLLSDPGWALTSRLLGGSGLLPAGVYDPFPVGESRELAPVARLAAEMAR